MTQANKNKSVVCRYFREVWNQGNLAVADEVLAPDFGGRVPSGRGAISGREAAKLYVSSYREAFPNIYYTLLSLAAEGDNVVACWIGRGLHSLPEDCAESTKAGCAQTVTGLSVYRLRDGKIVEAWCGSDHKGVARKLGIAGYPQQRKRISDSQE
jgi:predicted SnoaL-like aldol condensation-catalyzing enzyme